MCQALEQIVQVQGREAPLLRSPQLAQGSTSVAEAPSFHPPHPPQFILSPTLWVHVVPTELTLSGPQAHWGNEARIRKQRQIPRTYWSPWSLPCLRPSTLDPLVTGANEFPCSRKLIRVVHSRLLRKKR